MSINPYTEQLLAAQNRSAKLSDDLKNIRNEIEWFESVNLGRLQKSIATSISEIEDKQLVVSTAGAEAHAIELELKTILASRNSLWNPKNWLNKDQRDIRKTARDLQDSLHAKKASYAVLKKSLNDCQNILRDKQDEIKKYHEFDLAAKEQECSEITGEIEIKRHLIEHLTNKKNKIDLALGPITNQMTELATKAAKAKKNHSRAQELDNELSRAGNSYEKAMVHQKCEAEFGTGSPRKVLSTTLSDIHRFERDLEKLEVRAESIVSNSMREIVKLIIDGNNLCYEGNDFIGLKALKALIPALRNSYELLLVFDASVRRLLQSGDADLREEFGDGLKVHIVASRNKADETVLDLAGKDPTTFVVSNDRFAEFRDKPAVRFDRLIRHEIVDGNVFISSLGISVAYE